VGLVHEQPSPFGFFHTLMGLFEKMEMQKVQVCLVEDSNFHIPFLAFLHIVACILVNMKEKVTLG